MLDLATTELTAEDKELLAHPSVGGVILFARNGIEPMQLNALTTAIRTAAKQPLLIAVDQEGGRVQRFHQGFTRLPSAATFGRAYQRNPNHATAAATAVAWLLATELRAVGIDFSFAPVLDIDNGISSVIGDRAFANDPATVSAIGLAWLAGLHAVGMAGCGKHFPGHGSVSADSHTALPIDSRPYSVIAKNDLVPFKQTIMAGLDAIMPAHVIYSDVDELPASLSPIWLKHILRQQIGFNGAIFSDDLNMAGAAAGGDYIERAYAALNAGCDMILICNNRDAAIAIVDGLKEPQLLLEDWSTSAMRLIHLRGSAPINIGDELAQRRRALAMITHLDDYDDHLLL